MTNEEPENFKRRAGEFQAKSWGMTNEELGNGNLQLVILGLDPRIHQPIRLAMVSKATSTSHMITVRQTRPTTEAR